MKQNNSNNDNEKDKINLTQVITVFISAATLCFGIFKYFQTENMIDVRKYRNAFYDERYRVIKEETNSVAEITKTFAYNPIDSVIRNHKELVAKKMAILSYSHIVLNKTIKSDSLLLNYQEQFEQAIFMRITFKDKQYTTNVIDSLGKKLIVQCGEILKNYEEYKNKYNNF